MIFCWQLPNDPPDPAALARMKQHFPKPTELMPFAWFMGEIDFFTNLDESQPDDLSAKEVGEALHEIAGGLIAFPDVEFVPVWTDWFHYLLSYTLDRADDYSVYGSILINLIINAMIIYPEELSERYSGFRDDLVYALGTRVIPLSLSRDTPDIANYAGFHNPVFNDIWDFSWSPSESPGLSDDFSLPMIFCLKYLYPSEVENWTVSIVEINSPQWRYAVIGWWLALHKFLQLAQDWPADGNIESWLHGQTGLITDFWLAKAKFASLDQLFPSENLAIFQATLKQHLSLDRFQAWVADIRSHQHLKYVADEKSYPLYDELRMMIERDLHAFESQFFTA